MEERLGGRRTRPLWAEVAVKALEEVEKHPPLYLLALAVFPYVFGVSFDTRVPVSSLTTLYLACLAFFLAWEVYLRHLIKCSVRDSQLKTEMSVVNL